MKSCSLTLKKPAEPVLDKNIIRLDPRIALKLRTIADAQGIEFNRMGNIMLWRVLNPSGEPLEP